MLDIPIKAARDMIGLHVLWQNRNHDEAISWTNSMLFIIVHAQGRMHKEQGDSMIALVDRRKAARARTLEHPNGGPAEFYNALDLINVFEVHKSNHWGKQSHDNLRARMYTHEFLSHGIIEYTGDELRHVSLRELIDNGLFELFPQGKIGEQRYPESLYRRCVSIRKEIFRNGSYQRACMPRRHVEIAWKLAGLFINRDRDLRVNGGDTLQHIKPPLHLFIQFLSLQSRPSNATEFQDWIKAHYTRKPFSICQP